MGKDRAFSRKMQDFEAISQKYRVILTHLNPLCLFLFHFRQINGNDSKQGKQSADLENEQDTGLIGQPPEETAAKASQAE